VTTSARTENAQGSTTGATGRPAAELEIIIPAYNEAARLPRTLERTVAFLAAQRWDARIVVVDNGSVDDTAGVVREIAERTGGAVPIDLIGCSRPGKGAAVRRGVVTSNARYVGFFDADLSTPVETLTAAMFHLRSGAGAVIASRHAPGARFAEPQPLGRRLGGAAFRALSRTVVPGVHDSQCGFKFFERGVALRAISDQRHTGFAFDVELLRRVQQGGDTIVELPVTWTDEAGSTFHPVRDGIPSFVALLQLRAA
jgi:dolichyl-phosphate beta-glucosyltransferase